MRVAPRPCYFAVARAGALACAVLLVGITVLSPEALHAARLQVAADEIQQSTPAADPAKPAESKPGGTRPTNPAPEPAHPDPEAQKQGAKAALPLAPAEKIAPPIKEKQ